MFYFLLFKTNIHLQFHLFNILNYQFKTLLSYPSLNLPVSINMKSIITHILKPRNVIDENTSIPSEICISQY